MAERADYIKTGNSAFTRIGNKLSVIPFVAPVVATPFLLVGLLIDSGKWLMRGKVGSAATELATGTVSGALNIATGAVWWITKVGSVGFTGHTVGTHGRAMAETVIGGITGALGAKPKVLQSYPAGIGSLPGAGMYYQQQAPGYWATRAAQEQGKDPSQRWQQYRNGDGRDHVAALQNAALQPQTRGI